MSYCKIDGNIKFTGIVESDSKDKIKDGIPVTIRVTDEYLSVNFKGHRNKKIKYKKIHYWAARGQKWRFCYTSKKKSQNREIYVILDQDFNSFELDTTIMNQCYYLAKITGIQLKNKNEYVHRTYQDNDPKQIFEP